MIQMTSINQQDDSHSGKKKPTPSAKEPVGNIARLTAYLQGVKAEWGKISWPTWPQIWAQTIVVLVMVSLVTLGLLIIDKFYTFVIGLLLQILPPSGH